MGVNANVTAKSARELANKAERMINIILKNIKESSERGRTKEIFNCDFMNEHAQLNIKTAIENLGFTVKTDVHMEKYPVSPGIDVENRMVTFIIEW